MGKIVLEDFYEGDGYYKVNLAYLSKDQVEEIEALVSKWNPTDGDIKNCIAMCLTDANEQRFKDYGTNLKDCLVWLEKQGEQKSLDVNTTLINYTKLFNPNSYNIMKILFDEIEKQDLADCHAYLSQFEDMIKRTYDVPMYRFLPDIARKRLFIAELLGWSEEEKYPIRKKIAEYLELKKNTFCEDY